MLDTIPNSNIDSIYVQNIEKHLYNCQYKIDSLLNVLDKHQVSESYFNHILTAQLGMFTLLVSLIVLISIGGYIVFVKKYLRSKIKRANEEILKMFEIEKLKLSAWNNFALYELYNKDSNKAIECIYYLLRIADIYMTRKVDVNDQSISLNEYINQWIDVALKKFDSIDKISANNYLSSNFERIFNSIDNVISENPENVSFSVKVLEIKKKYYSLIR